MKRKYNRLTMLQLGALCLIEHWPNSDIEQLNIYAKARGLEVPYNGLYQAIERLYAAGWVNHSPKKRAFGRHYKLWTITPKGLLILESAFRLFGVDYDSFRAESKTLDLLSSTVK